MTEQEFVQFVKKECDYYGVKFKLGRGEYVKSEGKLCSGYFDDVNKVLACASKNGNFIGVLAHEYCHMRQWVEKAEVWVRADETRSYEAWSKHISGEDIDMELHFNVMRDLELDNEKRTVALIKKLSLPIDVKDYIKKANAYVMFYNYMKITGKWCKPGNTPYTNKRILEVMPDKFNLDYTKLPKRFEKVFREEKI